MEADAGSCRPDAGERQERHLPLPEPTPAEPELAAAALTTAALAEDESGGSAVETARPVAEAAGTGEVNAMAVNTAQPQTTASFLYPQRALHHPGHAVSMP